MIKTVEQMHIKVQGQINPDELKENIIIGLDTNILIDLIRFPLVVQHLDRRFNIFQKKLIIISEISKRETIEKLIKKYAFSKLDAEKEVEKLIRSLNITVLRITNNTHLIAEKIKIHYPDNYILANLKENKVTHILSIDADFINTAKAIGLHAIKIPNAQSIQDIEFRNTFKRSSI